MVVHPEARRFRHRRMLLMADWYATQVLVTFNQYNNADRRFSQDVTTRYFGSLGGKIMPTLYDHAKACCFRAFDCLARA